MKKQFMMLHSYVACKKEFERKKLGNEVLMLYQEVNMIFNFSDKLAQTINPKLLHKLRLMKPCILFNQLAVWLYCGMKKVSSCRYRHHQGIII